MLTGESTPNAAWKDDINAAKQLGYSNEVIQKLRSEPNPIKRTTILTSARKAMTEKRSRRK